jgi:hypothetical protein
MKRDLDLSRRIRGDGARDYRDLNPHPAAYSIQQERKDAVYPTQRLIGGLRSVNRANI